MSSFRNPWRLAWCALAVLCGASLLSATRSWAQENDLADKLGDLTCDPAEVLGPDSCTKCHESEMQQWMRTPHFSTFDRLHRTPEAKAIADRMGLGSIKRNDTCVRCHYTQQQVGSRVRVVSGVSCESCHGAARDWVESHADYGGATRETETPEHRAERITASVAAGMNNPANLYLIARQCLACHTTPDEALVNTGGHVSGSSQFELVAWSQGMVRHNFLNSGGTANAPATPTELRVMYVVGIMADLEASLRATAAATSKAPFGIASAQRAATMKKKLYEVSRLIESDHVDQALDAALSVPLKLNHQQQLHEAADAIGKAAYRFADTADGEKFSALDSLLPAPSRYK